MYKKIKLNTMTNKSLIQTILEQSEYLHNFKKNMENLLENYIISDNIFKMSNNGQVLEQTSGYFIPINSESYDDMNKLFENFTSDLAIRITNDKFQLGKIYNKITECPETDKIYEIKNC